MNLSSDFEQKHVEALQMFFSTSGNSSSAMSYCEATGFLFVVACSPEIVPPSKWLQVLVGEDEFKDQEQADNILGALMLLYNELNRQVQEADVALLPGCVFDQDKISNFGEHAPIGQWCRGFIAAQDWLQDMWDEYVPDALDEEYGAQLMMLSFFADKEVATEVYEESNKQHSFEEFVAMFQLNFPVAMAGFANLGNSIQTALQKPVPVRSEKIGRNEPCSCGSGKKYKKCCALNLH